MILRRLALIATATSAAFVSLSALAQNTAVAPPPSTAAVVTQAASAAAQAVTQAVTPPAAPAANVAPPAPNAIKAAVGAAAADADRGLAVVYSDKLNGRKTASGERYNRNRLTAAHKTAPFGSMIRVTNVKNKKSVVVRINDRGPFQPGRVIDLSPRAAKAIGIHRLGSAEVTLSVVSTGKGKSKRK